MTITFFCPVCKNILRFNDKGDNKNIELYCPIDKKPHFILKGTKNEVMWGAYNGTSNNIMGFFWLWTKRKTDGIRWVVIMTLRMWYMVLVEIDNFGKATVLKSFSKPAKDSDVKQGKKTFVKHETKQDIDSELEW